MAAAADGGERSRFTSIGRLSWKCIEQSSRGVLDRRMPEAQEQTAPVVGEKAMGVSDVESGVVSSGGEFRATIGVSGVRTEAGLQLDLQRDAFDQHGRSEYNTS